MGHERGSWGNMPWLGKLCSWGNLPWTSQPSSSDQDGQGNLPWPPDSHDRGCQGNFAFGECDKDGPGKHRKAIDQLTQLHNNMTLYPSRWDKQPRLYTAMVLYGLTGFRMVLYGLVCIEMSLDTSPIPPTGHGRALGLSHFSRSLYKQPFSPLDVYPKAWLQTHSFKPNRELDLSLLSSVSLASSCFLI